MARPIKIRDSHSYEQELQSIMRLRSAVTIDRSLPTKLREKAEAAFAQLVPILGELIDHVAANSG